MMRGGGKAAARCLASARSHRGDDETGPGNFAQQARRDGTHRLDFTYRRGMDPEPERVCAEAVRTRTAETFTRVHSRRAGCKQGERQYRVPERVVEGG